MQGGDRSLASRLGRAVARLEEACLAGSILGIAGLTIGNVVGRTLFDHSLAFADEISRFLIVVVTFLGVGYAASRGRHIRMTALFDQLPAARQAQLSKLIHATTAGLLLYFAYLGLRYALGTLRALGSVSPVLEVPLWIVALVAPLGLALGAIQYALRAADDGLAPVDDETDPAP